MQTIKTAVVVVLLLFVLYGGYVAMNGTDTPLKAELELGQLESFPDVSGPSPIATSTTGNASSAFDMFNSTPSKGFATSPGSNASPSATLPVAESTVPPIAFPTSPAAPMQPAPLLIPSGLPTANAPSSTTLPPLASTPSSSFNPPLPSSNEERVPQNLTSPGIPISTSTPNFDGGLPDAANSSGAASASQPSAVTPLPLPGKPSDVSLNLPTGDSAASSIKSSASKAYENAKDLAMEQIERNSLKDALATLSVFYNAAELTTEQRNDLLDLLDALTREVVFSRQHLLDVAYVVAPGETLEQIAKRYDIPSEILARINAIDPSAPLRSGEKLKVVPGPFRAEVDMAKNELTLFVGANDLYAGRYPVTFGSEPSPLPGVFQVQAKQKNRNYYGNVVQIPANDPRNPFGGYWIDLGQNLCIHGSPSTGPSDSKMGCISLSPMDANDVFGMLSSGSQVTIRR